RALWAASGIDPQAPGVFTETDAARAVAALVEQLGTHRATFVSLHNAEFGDPFFILSHAVPGLAGQLAAIAARHGLPAAEAAPSDVVGWPVLGRGVFQMPSVEELVIRDHTREARPTARTSPTTPRDTAR
ncbi:hypothetical protein ACIQVZ_40000, partial [Kitasatospora sp. NPDC098663]